MLKSSFLILILVSAVCFPSLAGRHTDFVDPFIGTGGHGHTFPGAALPNGMVQLSPDNHLMGWDASSGYHYNDTTIYAFSHTHLSGTGNGDMGDIALLPFTGDFKERPVALMDKSSEKAVPGYYAVTFKNYGIRAELTATQRTGFHRYTYTENTSRKLLFDLGFVLQPNWGHKVVGQSYEKVSDNAVSGFFQTTGWARRNKIFYYIEFSENIISEHIEGERGEDGLRVYLDFGKGDAPLLIKAGISYVDERGARLNLEKENPGWNFERIVKNADRVWEKALSSIEISTPEDSVKRCFYTSLYHTMIAPYLCQDVDGRYLGMDQQIHEAESGYTAYTVFSMWDTFRALHPLVTIIDPEKAEMFGNVLVRAYEEGGMIPRWALACNYTGIMVGYPGVSVVADLVCKGLCRKENLELWSEAARRSSVYRSDGPISSPWQYYKDKYEVIPEDSIWHSVSWGVECAYYDWAVARIAEAAGDEKTKEEFDRKSKYYLHYMDRDLVKMRPVNADRSFIEPYQPRQTRGYQEGNGFQWSYFVPHDMDRFIMEAGGPERFETSLDTLFNTSSRGNHGADVTGLIGQYAHGNEPSHHIAYLYNWTDSPEKGQEILDRIMRDFYSCRPDGIIGNEDCGQMSAWYVLSAMGFYQVCPGKPEYAIGRPLLDEVEIKTGGRPFRIKVKNNSEKNKYVKEVRIDGKILDRLFFTHEDILNGSCLAIEMTDKIH